MLGCLLRQSLRSCECYRFSVLKQENANTITLKHSNTLTILHRTFYVPPRFHPAYSLLGRGLRRLVGDARRAEALFLIALSMLALGLLLGQFFAWMWLKTAILATPLGPVAMAFWLGQIGAVAVCLLTCVVGFVPAITITVNPTHLHLRQGRHECTLPYGAITSTESVSALTYYRHYRPYAATQAFVNRMTPQVLLLHTPEAPIALSLLPEDHDTVLHLLDEHLTPAFDTPVARVA